MLRETTSRCMCGLVCPSRTSERGGDGDCVKEVVLFRKVKLAHASCDQLSVNLLVKIVHASYTPRLSA